MKFVQAVGSLSLEVRAALRSVQEFLAKKEVEEDSRFGKRKAILYRFAAESIIIFRKMHFVAEEIEGGEPIIAMFETMKAISDRLLVSLAAEEAGITPEDFLKDEAKMGVVEAAVKECLVPRMEMDTWLGQACIDAGLIGGDEAPERLPPHPTLQ